MNIFVTNPCPVESAKALDDKRVVKMVLESAQLLSSAMHLNGAIGPYKLTHKGHPCTLWTARTAGNYGWVLKHFLALCAEYTARYGKTHKCESLAPSFKQYLGRLEGPLEDFVNCTPHKDKPTLDAYVLTMSEKWEADKRQPTWYGVK